MILIPLKKYIFLVVCLLLSCWESK